MNSAGRMAWAGMLAAAVLLAAPRPLAAADDSRYATVTIRGSLSDPETGRPMPGAVVRFISTAEDGTKFVGITDEKGAFFVPGLQFGVYVVNITTADGEVISGVNELPVTPEAAVGVLMKISKRIRSRTLVDNRPQRFVAVIQRP